MSGPKVVRIVTREELIAICRRQLARLDAVVARWVKEGRRLGNLNDTEIAAAQRRRDQLVDLLEKDRFAEVQRAIVQEISFLRADQEERLNKAAAAAAQARSNARREEQAAKALLSALRRAGKPLPVDLERALEEAARGMGSPATALSAGFALLSTPSAADAVDLKALADGLKGGDRDRRFETWAQSQPPSADELLLSKVEGRISELAALAGGEAAAPYELRLVTLRRGEQSDRHLMLLDSLMLDLSKA